MAFTKSLYYPWIDIEDEGWLKSAALYWDTIQTKVPISIREPYSTKTARYLEGEGILIPFRISSNLEEVEELTPDVITYMRSQEGMELLTGADHNLVKLHPDKLPASLRRLSLIHPEKISYEILDTLHHSGQSRKSRNGFIEVSDDFASFYMTLLATKLSERIGAGLVTPSILPHRLSLRVKTDSQIADTLSWEKRHEYGLRHRQRIASRNLAQGMLVELMLEEIAIDPSTPIDEIVKYRNNHSSELGRFRTKVGELTSSLQENIPIQAMRQHVSDLYINQVKPAIDDLKHSLTSNRIKWLTDGWMKLAFISVGSSSMLMGMGLTTGNALLAGAGISLIGCGILYNTAKGDTLRANPYSYIMNLEGK